MKRNLHFPKRRLVPSQYWRSSFFILLFFCIGTAAQAQLSVSLSSQNPTCGSVPNGSISSLVTGGTQPYSYSWSNGATTPNLVNVPEGTYTLNVNDMNGNFGSETVTLVAPPTLNLTIQSDCNIPYSATAVVNGGVPPFMYMWSNGATTPTINNLPAGEYCVTIMDANTCGSFVCSDIGLPPNATVTTTDAGCAGGSGSATANASGGNSPYTYLWSTGATSQTINNLAPGTYMVTVTGSNGCSFTTNGTVSAGGNSFPVFLNTTPPTCNGTATGSITANPNGGVFPYTYSWNTGATTQSITGLAAGTYTVTVTDAQGCSTVKTTTLTASNDLGVWVMSTPTTCPNTTDGTASVNGMGGFQPYSYQWSNGQSGGFIGNLAPGVYTVTTTDAAGCTYVESTTVVAGVGFTLSVTGNNATTCSGTNGSATATPNGGNAPFSYQWSNDANTQTITNLGAGTYFITATDNTGCQSTGSVTITAPTNFPVSIQATPAVCANDANGMASAFPSGGSAPYTYQWSNGGNTQTINNLVPGTYSVTVFDALGCQGTATTTISGGTPLTVDAVITNILCKGDATGAIEAAGWGGTPPYSYVWNTGQTTALITNLTFGFYTVTVTDAAGCTATATFEVTEPAPILIDVITNNSNCAGSNSGSINTTVTGGAGGYTYQWSNGQTTPNIFNLAPGTYFLTVTDANNCTALALGTVTGSPGLDIFVSKNNVTCFGGNDGSATVNINGGTAPFFFQWSTGATTQSINNLVAGNYSVTVTDANGCTDTEMVNIGQAQPINLSISATPAVCTGNTNGTATVNASGGTPGYSFLWNNGATTQTINNLPPGVYSVTATDANGCTQTASATIIESADYTIDVATQDVFCNGENTGSVLVSGWGGTPPYTYIWNTGSTNPQLSNLFAGTYTVTVTDAAGCVISEDVVINEPPVLTVSATGTNPNCPGDTGSATATGNGGVPPYTYQWSNFQNGQTITNLTPGTYSVTVLDANFCDAVTSITISGTANFSATVQTTNPTCSNANDGSATATPIGGTAPFSYNWSTGQNTQTISGLGGGTYTVTITDNNGCTATASGTVMQPAAVNVNVTDNDINCFGDANGSATASASGGNGPYNFNWSSGQNTAAIFNLATGFYTVTVTDQNGCTAIGNTEITTQPDIVLSANATQASCGANNGTATAMATGGAGNFTYLWSTGATSTFINNLATGTYSVTVTDALGCTDVTSTTVTGSDNPTVSVSTSNIVCFGDNNGTATANANSGPPPYSYNWSNGQTGASISNLGAGTYTVTVSDANGCTATATGTVNQPQSIAVTVSGTDETCPNDNDGTATASAVGGVGGFTYNWNNGASGQTITGLAAGTYTVTATDQNGCTGTGTVTINEPNALSINLNPVNPVCNGDANGSVNAMPIGGNAPYSYSWNTGANTQNINNLSAGTYSVTVTDGNGCTATSSVTLTDPAPINVSVSTTATCNGVFDGTATANASGGTGGYTYQWNNGGNTVTISNLAAGSYTVTVTDANGCTGTATAQVANNSNPNCMVTVVQEPSAPGANDGVLTVNLNNINPTDSYQWSNGATTQTVNNLPAGTYSVTVTSAQGCTSVCSANLLDPDPCDNVTDAGTICCDQTLCGPGNDPDPITQTVAPSGGSGQIEYLWMSSTIPGPFSNGTYTIIPGATGVNYDPGPISETTFFVRCVRRQGCTEFLETNIITVFVDDDAVAEINGADFVCVNDLNTFAATFSGPNATYNWTFGGTGASPTSSTDIVVNNVSWNVTGFKPVTLVVEDNGCTSTAELTVFASNSTILCANPLVIQVEPINQELVSINWNMLMPDDGEYEFDVERSFDGINFESIGTMIDPTSTTGDYIFMDDNPKRGRSFYRVKLSDDLGQSVYSNVEEIQLNAGVGIGFLYPNPTTGAFFVELNNYLNAEEITLEVISPNGILLDTQVVDPLAVRTQLDLSQYPNGMYFVVVNFNGNRHQAMRIVKSTN